MGKISTILLFEMERRGVSEECISGLCGISRNEVSELVRMKKKDLRLSTLHKICSGLGLDISEIFAEDLKQMTVEKINFCSRGERYVAVIKKEM